MKKLFIAMMAMAAFAACSNEEPVASLQGDAIAFGDAFVDNSVRAIYDEANDITGFTVYGNVQGTGAVVALYGDGAPVTRGGATLNEAWSCEVVRYWTPSCQYNFAAVANHSGATLEAGVPTKIEYTVDSSDSKDLIYGATTANTDVNGAPESGVNENGIVAFTMNHLLSRVMVSFQNVVEQEDESPYTYAISNVKIKTWAQGTYTVNPVAPATPWERLNSGDATLTFTAPATEVTKSAPVSAGGAQLVIPGADVEVSFDYVLKFNGTPIYSNTVSGNVTGLEVGHSYNITATLDLDNKIEFTVDDETNLGWGADTTTPIL